MEDACDLGVASGLLLFDLVDHCACHRQPFQCLQAAFQNPDLRFHVNLLPASSLSLLLSFAAPGNGWTES
jgi:hypothetical protein